MFSAPDMDKYWFKVASKNNELIPTPEQDFRFCSNVQFVNLIVFSFTIKLTQRTGSNNHPLHKDISGKVLRYLPPNQR